MMKVFGFVLVALLAPVLVNAHPFTICKNAVDHFHVTSVSITPDKPEAGKKLTVSVSFKPDITVSAPISAKIGVKVFGVHIFGTEIEDLCTYLAGSEYSCPFAKDKAQTLTLSIDEVPDEVPSKIEANVEIGFFSSSSELSCIDITVDTAATAASAESENLLRGSEVGHSDKTLRFMFTKWLEQFHTLALDVSEWYPTMGEEKHKVTFEERFAIFAKNFVSVLEHNRKYRQGKVTYAMKLNQFAHLTGHEFRSVYLTGYRRSTGVSEIKSGGAGNNMFRSFFNKGTSKAIPLIPSSPASDVAGEVAHDDLPIELDWVAKGAVTQVKNQGSCGSCWAFSAIAALESAYFLKYGVLKEFSEQELVSCEEDCYGCRGGLMDEAFNWIRAHGGVCSESDYPYSSGSSGANGVCKISGLSACKPDSKAAITQFVNVQHSEDALKIAVAQQPVSIAIEADQYAFQFYSHGVITAECGDRDDHGVIIVGYGNLDGVDFWKVKNSWGPTWGMEGYVLLQRGKQVANGDGECGLLVDPVYPVL